MLILTKYILMYVIFRNLKKRRTVTVPLLGIQNDANLETINADVQG